MKRIIFGLLTLLLLMGCSVEQSPESYFDIALTEVEALESYQTCVVLSEGNEELLKYTAEVHQGEVSILEIEDTEVMKQMASFNYANAFGNFSQEGVVVTCEIPLEDSQVFKEFLEPYGGEDIKKVTHHMYLDGQSLDYVEIIIDTDTSSFQCNITMD